MDEGSLCAFALFGEDARKVSVEQERCIPLLFPIWAPVALVASFTRQGDLSTRG